VGSVGFSEILIIAVVALFFLGPDRLPQAARSLGKAMSEFRRITSSAKADLDEAIDSAGMRETLAEIKGTVDELNPRRVVGDTLRALDTPTPQSVVTGGATAASAAGSGAISSHASLIPPPDADMAESMNDSNALVIQTAPVAKVQAPGDARQFHDILSDDILSDDILSDDILSGDILSDDILTEDIA
jgi:sec-independent protein translocase protein TatB